MGVIGYLYHKTIINRVKTAMRGPITYAYLVLLLFYLTAIPFSLRMFAENLGMDSPEGMAAVMSFIALWMLPGNLASYAKRRGLAYRNCDVHFMFPSPVGPKQVLLYAHIKNMTAGFFVNIFVIICGVTVFHVENWRLAVYLLLSVVAENILEGSFMLLLYGSEKIGERQRSLIVKVVYCVIGVSALIAICVFWREGLSIKGVLAFLHSRMLWMVPVVGWYIAALHLLLTGVDAVNIAGTCAYVFLLVCVAALAWRMECTGAYYEDAMKFAEDYEVVLESRRRRESSRRFGKKRHFGNARVKWRGHGARALFYRQMLEYKKSRYFLFDINTVAALVCGALIAYLQIDNYFESLGEGAAFAIPVVSGYVIFLFSGKRGKWEKELVSPYTYLIPDTAFRKLMNATALQHVQGFINACLITLPGALAMKLPLSMTALAVLFYVAFSADKLYALTVAEVMAGDVLGAMGKQFFQMFLQGIAVFLTIPAAMAGMAAGSVLLAYFLMDLCLILYTAVLAVIATLNFDKMEKA